MNQYFQITIPVASEELREILVAELSMAGFESFEEDGKMLKAFIEEGSFDQASFDSVTHRYHLTFELELLPVRNWNEEWEKNFEPVVIGNFCSVRANFHPPNEKARYDIIITPKMSFGTGHHATTYLMLEMMQELKMRNATVFDFGTGTGILSIMSEMLGAKEVVAIDIDEWSIENARENLEINGCRNVRLLLTDNIPTDKSFRFILANINRNVIQECLSAMCKIVEAEGEILLSGLLDADFELINGEATNLGLHLQKKGEKSGWIALSYSK